MRVSERHPEEQSTNDIVSYDHDGGLLPAEFQAEFRDKEEWLRQRQELIHALRNFAKHFGAAEVYQQAKAIYLESPAGQAEIEQEQAASFDSVLRDTNRSESERQKGNTPVRRTRGGSPALEDAKRALGG